MLKRYYVTRNLVLSGLSNFTACEVKSEGRKESKSLKLAQRSLKRTQENRSHEMSKKAKRKPQNSRAKKGILGKNMVCEKNCSSFAAYLAKTFGYLNEEEENLFMTQRTFDSFCRSCLSSVTLNSSILLTVVTAYGLNQLGLDNNMWPIFVTQMHTNPGRLNCTNCDTQTSERVLRNVLNSRFLFIEFSPALMKDINVFEDIEISGAQYKLRGVVTSI